MRHLASFLRANESRVNKLDLRASGIGPDGAHALMSVVQHSRLRELDLSSLSGFIKNSLGPQVGLMHTQALRPSTRHRRLDIPKLIPEIALYCPPPPPPPSLHRARRW